MKVLINIIRAIFISSIFTLISALLSHNLTMPFLDMLLLSAPFISLALLGEDAIDLIPGVLPAGAILFFTPHGKTFASGVYAVLMALALITVSIRHRKMLAIIPALAGAFCTWFSHNMTLGAFLTLSFFIFYFWTFKMSWFRKSIRPFPLIHFPILVLAGGFLGGRLNLNLLTSALAFACAWEFGTGVNDIFDVEIDRVSNPERPLPSGTASRFQYEEVTMVNGLTALFLSFTSSVHFHVALFMFLTYIYSAPPLRLKKYPVGSIFIALGSIIAFHAGIYSAGQVLNGEILKILLVVFLAFACGTVVKDIKDVEGDRKAGVTTIYTVLGIRRGLTLTYFLLAVSFFSPLILLKHPLISDIFFVTIFWALASILLAISKRPFITFLPYLLEFAYVFLRYKGYF